MESNKLCLFVRFTVALASDGYFNLGNDDLICLAEECLALSQHLKYIIFIFVIYNWLGELYQVANRFTEAFKYYKKQLKVAIQIEDQKLEGLAYRNLGDVCNRLGNYREAMKYHEKHLKIALQKGDQFGEGVAYVKIGDLYHSLRNYQEALKYNVKGLNIAEEIGNKELKMNAYNGLGNTYYTLDKYIEAIKYYEKQLEIAVEIGDKTSEGTGYNGLGNSFYSLEKYTPAIKYYEKHLNVALEIGDKDGQQNSYEKLGNTYKSLGQFQKAIECLEKSQQMAKDTGNKKAEGSTYEKLWSAYNSLGKYYDAIGYQKKALKLATEMGSKNLESSACLDLGATHQLLGKYQEAINYYKRALKIAKETSDKVAESVAYGNLGATYNSQGKYYDAILCCEFALKIVQETGNKRSEAYFYGNLGEAYRMSGKIHEGIKCLEKCLDIAIKMKDKNAQGTAFGNLGIAYKTLGRSQEAIDYYSKQLNIALELGNKFKMVYAYKNLGDVYHSLEKVEDSKKYYEKQLIIAKEIGDKRNEGKAYGSLGGIYCTLGENHKAIELNEKYLNTARDIGDKDGEANAYINLGMFTYFLGLSYKEQHDQENFHLYMKKSESYFEEGVKCFESIFDHLQQQDSLKVSIVDTFIYAYRMLTLALIETEQIEKALLVSERGRARALRDLLIWKYNLMQEKSFQSNHSKVSDLVPFLPKPNFCVLFYALQFVNAACWVLAHQKPVFFRTIKMKTMASELAKPYLLDQMKTSITDIVYEAYDKMNVRGAVKCEDRSFRSFDVVSGHVNDKQEPQKETKVVKEKTSDVSSATETRCIPDEDIYDQGVVTNPLETLFDELIAPAVHNLTEDEVVIIPDGPLNMVPFAALTDPNTGLFLSETKRIRLAPSLSALKALQECPVDHHSQKGALIVGGPDIGEVMFKGNKRSFSPLPFAKHEAKTISDVLGVAPLIGSQATKEAVIQRLREGLAVIHFAAHGSENGEILLAPSVSSASRSTPEEEDYILTVKEVQEKGIRAQLVVLSCCHSGRGEIKAEGVIGMSRAFLAAGARAVVASLWAIDDEATMVFMLNFYSHLKRGETGSTSLRQAMKEMRETERHREPKYWASFFLIGDDVKICL